MRFLLQNARLAFGNGLYHNRPMPGETADKGAYNCKALIAPDHPQVAQIEAAIEAVAREAWGTKAAAILKGAKAVGKTCIHDGDTKPNWTGFEGMKFISMRSKIKPTVFDRDKVEVSEESGIVYSGCYGNFSMDIFAYDKPQYGVSAQIRGFQKTADGDSFGGGTRAGADDFPDAGDTGEVDPLS
jgi:hypothetical protein